MRGWWVPGRIEFLGKHTDYAGGRSLTCATEQGLCLVARPLEQRVLRLLLAATGERAELALAADVALPAGEWTAYPASVVRRLVRDFGPLRRGAELAIAGDLPRDAGLSSSSALVIGVALALAGMNRLEERPAWRAALPDRESLAGYLGAVESGKAFGGFAADFGVGTLGGTQDHTAILCARPGALVQYRFVPVHFERAVPFPPEAVLAIGVSGVAAPKQREALAGYNARALAAERLLAIWQRETGGTEATLFAALASEPGARERLRALLRGDPDEAALAARLEQFAVECSELVPGAGEALRRGDWSGLGTLADRSQAGAERGLGNQVPETVHLQRSARRLGALAASAFGAGFGGSVWAMLPRAAGTDFLARWEADYRGAFPARRAAARFFTTVPAPAAAELPAAALRA